MPTVQELLERINTEVADKAIAQALANYMNEEVDLFEDFAEEIVDIIKGNPNYMNKIAEATVANYIRAIENGEVELLNLESFDEINGMISEKIGEMLKTGISKIRV